MFAEVIRESETEIFISHHSRAAQANPHFNKALIPLESFQKFGPAGVPTVHFSVVIWPRDIRAIPEIPRIRRFSLESFRLDEIETSTFLVFQRKRPVN